MKDVPIIFSAPMVRALLDGRKTMTRRLAWHERRVADPVGKLHLRGDRMTPWTKVKPGDQLWVRETWQNDYIPSENPDAEGQHVGYLYRADDEGETCKWRSPIYCPRIASRLTLVVTAAKIQRLQAMVPEDAIAEGLKGLTKDGKLTKYGIPDRDGLPGDDDYGWHWADWRISPVDAFERIWSGLHGIGAWKENPEVVALTFTVHQQSIDVMTKAAAA
jgi:hypothetical protein